MKLKYVWIFIVIIVIAVALWLFFREPGNPPIDQTERIEQLTNELNLSKEREAELKLEDSLKAFRIGLLEKQIVGLQQDIHNSTAAIDQELEIDSARALEENRKALRDLGIKTGSTSQLSFFEMGWNAKFLRENIGMKLIIRKHEEKDIEQESRIVGKDLIIKEKEIQLTKTDSLKILAGLQIEFLEGELDKFNSFFYDRFIFYGGAGINYNGVNIAPGAQLGFGIKIYSVNFK